MACFWATLGGSEGEIKDDSLRKGITGELSFLFSLPLTNCEMP